VVSKRKKRGEKNYTFPNPTEGGGTRATPAGERYPSRRVEEHTGFDARKKKALRPRPKSSIRKEKKKKRGQSHNVRAGGKGTAFERAAHQAVRRKQEGPPF